MKRKSPLTTPTPAVNISEASRLMNISERSIYRMINAGTFPARKFGSRTLVLRTDVERWCRSLNRVGNGSGSVESDQLVEPDQPIAAHVDGNPRRAESDQRFAGASRY